MLILKTKNGWQCKAVTRDHNQTVDFDVFDAEGLPRLSGSLPLAKMGPSIRARIITTVVEACTDAGLPMEWLVAR